MSPDNDSFSIKLGQWFEAKAQGRFAIVVLVTLLVGVIVAKATGLWH